MKTLKKRSSPKKGAASPKRGKRSPRRKNIIKRKLRGGAGNCMNNHTAAGIPIDPIDLNSIPLNKIIRVPITWIEDPITLHPVPAPDTDYHCYNQTNLLEWLKTSMKNPFTNEKFDMYKAHEIFKQIKGKRYILPTNNYVSPFSTYAPVSDNVVTENPFPKGLFAAMQPWSAELYFPDD